MRLLTIGFLMIGFVALLISPRVLIAPIIRVPSDYSTIQEAIDVANPGDEIRIAAGRYLERLHISKAIHLVGEGADDTLIGHLDYGPVIVIEDAEVVIEDLTIVKALNRWSTDGIDIFGESNVSIKDCIINIREAIGIRVEEDAVISVTDSVFRSCSFGIYLAGQGTFLGCDFTENDHGVEVLYEAGGTLQNCSFTDNFGGVRIYEDATCLIDQCTFEGNEFGLYVEDASILSGSRNRFLNNDTDIYGPTPVGFLARTEGTETLITLPSPTYATLEEAIDALAPRGVIRLQSGSYPVAMTIDKELSIVSEGEGTPEIRAPVFMDPPFRVVTGGCLRLEGLSLVSHGAVIAVYGKGEVFAEDCRIESSFSPWGCIVLENEAKATFRHCNIYVSEDEASSSGIVLHNRAELVFLESTISGFREYGIEARDESSAIEEGNHFEGMGIAFIGNVSPPIHLTEAAEQFSEVAYPDPRYLSLQQAIDAVCDGGVLVLESGEYEGKIRLVGKAITIRGDEEDPPVIKAAGGGQGVISLLQGADVVLEHLNLIGGEKCVLATVDATVQLKGCQIGQCVVGLELKNRAQATIEHSVFSLADDSGIHAEGMCTLQVYETTFSDCQHAMKIYGETELEVSGCALVGNDRGVAVADASRISVIDTLFEANGTGIDFQDVGSIEISQCRIVGSSDWAIDGTADNVRITDCLIEENEWGISMYFEVDSLEIMGCTICRNRVMGLSLTGGITGVVARCCMQGNGGDGIELGGYEDAPLNIALVETVVENNGHGVRCFHHVIGEMSGCSVTGNSGYGVYVARATELFGENNVIEGNGADVHSLSEETRNYLQPSSSGSGQEGIHLSPSDRTTLREAFAQVQSGGVITLEDGTYETAVLVDKDVSIRAASGATPILTPPMRDMDVFDVVGNARLTLEGVTISGGRIGIATYGTSAFLLNRCTFSDNLLGVWLYEESSGVVTESHFENNRSEGGVICETANAEFRRCSFVNHRSKWGYGKGLSFTDSSGAILDECAFLDNDFGLVFRGGPTVTMKNLLVEDNGKGIVVYGHGCVPPGAVIVEPFAGEITGSGNRIRGNLEMDLCPDLKADIWPEGFLSE